MSSSAKTLLLSILIMSILIPARAAGEKSPKVGLRKALLNMTLFNLFYVLAVTYVYPRLL
jgi:hypothetical protein